MEKVQLGRGGPWSRFAPEIKTRMGQQLRVAYGDVMDQGVPDCHQGLLNRLDAVLRGESAG